MYISWWRYEIVTIRLAIIYNHNMHHDKPEEVVVLAGVFSHFRLLAEFVFKRVVASFAFAVPSYNIVVIYIQFITQPSIKKFNLINN